MAMDLSTLPFTDDQFKDWARLQGEVRQQELVGQLEQGIDPKLHELELERADNFERLGYSMSNEDFSNTDDDDASWLMQRSNDLQTGFNLLQNKIGQVLVGPTSKDPTPSYQEYREKGGLLTEEEWESYSDETKKQLFERKYAAEQIGNITGLPGVRHGLYGLHLGYRGLATGVGQIADLRGRMGWGSVFPGPAGAMALVNGGPESAGTSLWRDIAPFFSGDEWARAWRESEERSLGNAMVDSLLSPGVAKSTLDKWRKTNSLYQMSSVGAEVLGTWYADGGVIALRGAGNLGRLSRNEVPLERNFLDQPSRMHAAVREAQQGREVISVRSRPAKAYAAWRAERLLDGQRGVEDFARAHDFATFANLPMFAKRASDGLAAAKALHIAANSGNENLLKHTWGALNGDARAIAEIERMKLAPSEALREFGGDAQVLAEAYDATKRKIPLLEAEMADLAKVEPNSPFHRWEIHAETRVKEEQVTRAKAALSAYGDDYLDWLSLMGTRADDPAHPTLSQYAAPTPRTQRWSDTEAPQDGIRRRFFMKHQFGMSHQMVKLPKAAILKKTGTVAMHDIDGGRRGINRYFDQLEQMLDYRAPEAKAEYLDRWISAETMHDRYKVLFEMEEQHLINALAGKLGISTQLAATIFGKVDAERTASINGLMSGKGQVYSSAPTLAQRVQDDSSTARLISEADDEGMVTFELMDHGRLTTVTTHESELVPRKAPVDPTQTPNYYRPADVRALYLEMKRHEDYLHDIDAGPMKWTQAEVARVNDLIGTKFYNLWKPAQLWRLGWPQRVLMDEGLRAAAIFGPMYWITGPGAQAVGRVATNAVARDLETLSSVITGRYRPGTLNVGDGPLKRATKHAENSFAYDNQIADAVKLPASRFPSINKSRYDRLKKQIDLHAPLVRSRVAASAWRRESDELYQRIRDLEQERRDHILARVSAGEEVDERLVARLNQQVEELQPKLDRANEQGRVVGRHISERLMDFPDDGYSGYTILYDDIADAFHNRELDVRSSRRERTDAGMVFDPVDGKELTDGFVVPIPNMPTVKVPSSLADSADQRTFGVNQLAHYFEQNAELLARTNVRLMATPEGDLVPAFYFRGKGAHAKAERALRDIADSLDLDADVPRMWDVAKGEAYYVKSRSDLSPMLEQLFRFLREEDPETLEPGITPAVRPDGSEVEERVFHGTDSAIDTRVDDGTLNLQPREEVYASRGNMVGPGFYTTVSQDMAENYTWGLDSALYVVRDSRTGERYEVFDLDQDMTRADVRDLQDWLRSKADPTAERYNRDLEPEAVTEDGLVIERMVHAIEEISNYARQLSHSRIGGRRTKEAPRRGRITWGNFLEDFPEGSRKKWITRYLEERKGAGVLTHTGGTSHGQAHQVYVWLHPENLEVMPAYAKRGEWQHVIDWWANPEARELPVIHNPVPENRIIRIGERNPMIRQLHTIHAKVEARKEDLKRKGKGYIADPEVREMIVREQELMRVLGLEYRGYASGGDPDLERTMEPNAWGQDWYEVADPDRFNRTVAEAHGINEQVDFAAAANGDLRAQEQINDTFSREFDMEDFDNLLDDPLRQIAEKMRRKYGSGHTTLVRPDGTQVSYPNVFEGHGGEIRRGLVSSAKAVDDLTANHGGGLDLMRRQAVGHKVYTPPKFTADALKRGTAANRKAVQYFHMWADLVNDQIGNSPIWDKMLRGWSDEKIAGWLRDTPEGYAARKEIMDPSQSIELFVNEHRARLDYYLPNKKLQRLLAKGRIKPQDLRKNVADEDLPDVFGPDIELLRTGWAKKTADAIWKTLGTIPIDHLSRHPFAKATYDMHMKALINQTDGDFLTDETVKRLQQVAHRKTLNDVRTTLFDLTDATNMTDALRFIAPFWNAQQEAIVKWLNITMERPETIARFFNGQAAVYRNFVVVDEEGNEVAGPTGEREGLQPGGMFGLELYHPNDKVIVQVPKWARKTAFGQALQTIGTLGIPLGSANTVLQGEMPLLPGPGPYLTVPVDKFLRAASDTHGTTLQETLLGDAYRWLFPIGRPSGGWRGVMEQISPGSVRRILSSTAPEDDVSKANLQWMVGRELHFEAEQKGTKPPTEAEIAKATNFLWGLRTFTSFVAPVQVQFRPKHQLWIDQAHSYREEFGVGWFDQFIQDYGKEASLYAISSSNSLPGVPPTLQGMEEWDTNKKLIAKYPDWGEAIISPDAYSDDYNQDVYRAQFEINLGPLDSRNIRDVRDASSRFAEAEKRVGWMEFRDFMSSVNAELYARGLTNLQQSGAEDLARLKAAFIADQTEKFPSWGKDFTNFSNDINIRVKELQDFAFRPEFDNRPDMQGARQYLMIREMATEQLDLRYAAGGSRSLQTEENADLRQWFYNNVGELIMSNPAFGEFYTRYLDSDALLQGGD